MKNPFRNLTRFEWGLYLTSLATVTFSFFLSDEQSVFNLIASLVGVTALIFIAKGYVIGQVLTIIFSTLYGIISFRNQYYGEVFTYLCMTAPMAVAALVSWIRHPYGQTKEVEVHKMRPREWVYMGVGAVTFSFVLYFMLAYFHTANLVVSTVSVTTSFMAVYMTYCRSPFYAIGYCLNDIVLITLWVMASIKDPSCLPVVFCFVMFFANDIYGFINWSRMEKRQNEQK